MVAKDVKGQVDDVADCRENEEWKNDGQCSEYCSDFYSVKGNKESPFLEICFRRRRPLSSVKIEVN